MSLFKKPKYFLIIMLASLTFVTFVPQFAFASGATDWLAEQLGIIIYYVAIKFPSLILLKEIEMFDLVGPYNGFTTQTQVVAAWTTVRDLANMFFILILLIMSFATILGLQGYGYKQLLSKLLLMAILINFSKSFVAILIDFSQIVTLTFLAPVLASLGANVIVAMGLQDIMNIDNGRANVPEGESYSAISYLMAMILGGIMMIITTVIMGVMLIMFVMRIIGLWIIVILAPLAFLARTFPLMSKYYGQWEGELSKNLTLGPGLAFFMWLAFSIVGNGTASSEFKPVNPEGGGERYVEDKESFTTAVSKVADTSHMLNFVIAITLLMAGLKFASASGVAGASMAGKASANLQKTGSRIARGATIGAATGVAVGAGTLAWKGTSGEGGVKGIMGQASGNVGKGMVTYGDKFKIGALQRGGIAMQAKESSRRQRKQAKFDKRFEGMTEEQQEAYNQSIVKGGGFLGQREAAANLAKRGLDGKTAIPAKEAKDMAKAFEDAGDFKSLERLRDRSMEVGTKESLEKQIATTGVGATLAKINPENMSAGQAEVLLAQDLKALASAIDSMPKKEAGILMAGFDALRARGEIKGSFDGTANSDLGKLRLLQGKFDAKDKGSSIHDTTSGTSGYASLTTDQKKEYRKNLIATSKAEDLIKIEEGSTLFHDVVGDTGAGKTAEMYNLATTEKQRESIINNQISMGHIENVINIPSVDKSKINDVDIIAGFSDQMTKLIAAATKRGLSPADAKIEAQGKIAHNDLKNGHLAFADSTGKVDDAAFSKFAQSLRLTDLLKLEKTKLAELIAANPLVIGTPHVTGATGLKTAQLKLLEEKEGIT